MQDLGLKTSIHNFDAFVGYTLMGNQPWPQFKMEFWKGQLLILHERESGETNQLMYFRQSLAKSSFSALFVPSYLAVWEVESDQLKKGRH